MRWDWEDFFPLGRILPEFLFLLLHYICSESWRKSLAFLCLSGERHLGDLSPFGVCLASCLVLGGTGKGLGEMHTDGLAQVAWV